MNQQLTFFKREAAGAKFGVGDKIVRQRRDGPALRDAGVAKLERHHLWLETARETAIRLCKRQGSVTSDDVHYAMELPPHPNCFGAVFRDKRFVPTGERVQTKRASGHARWIMRWRLI